MIELGARFYSPKKQERVKRTCMSPPLYVPTKRRALSLSTTPSVSREVTVSPGPSCASDTTQLSDTTESDSLRVVGHG